jgi:nucleoside-diphosphate-sugar epimerase
MELMVRCDHYTYWTEVPAIGITRCANVFGFGDTNQRRVIPLFVRSAVSDCVIPLKYRRSGRQFIHITDAIAGYIRAASSLGEGGSSAKVGKQRPEERSPFTPSYHFAIENYEGTPEPYIRMEPLARQVAGLFSAQVDDSECIDYPPNENKIQALNCRATCDALQWQAKKPFSEALRELGDWYKAEDNRGRLKELIDRDLGVLMAAVT